MMKKVLSAILALIMVISLFPAEVFAYAEDPEDESTAGDILPLEEPEDPDVPALDEEEPGEGTISPPSDEGGFIRPVDELTPGEEPEGGELDALPPVYDPTATSGSCGYLLYWSYDESTKVLTISGNGTMNDYTKTSSGGGYQILNRPWESYTSAITSVVFTGAPTKIGSAAFYRCTALKTAVLPDSLRRIGIMAFYQCSQLTGIEVPQGVTTIEDATFSFCSSLTSATLPEGLTSIGPNAFSGDRKLKTLNIPSTVRTIGEFAFDGCWVLSSITLPDGITGIERYAFGNCRAVTVINVPSGVTSIADYAFYNCYSCSTLYLPESLSSIGEAAFASCTALSTVYFGGSVNDWNAISMGANNDPLLNAEKIFASLYTAGEQVQAKFDQITGTFTVFGEGDMFDFTTLGSNGNISAPWDSVVPQIKKVVVKEGVTGIGDYAFYYCSRLTEISLPESLTRIGSNALSHTSALKQIRIPAGLLRLGANAFASGALETLSFGGSIQDWLAIEGQYAAGIGQAVLYSFDTEPSASWWHTSEGIFAFLDSASGELILDGQGAIPAYNSSTSNGGRTTAYWGNFGSQIRSLTIRSGITGIGGYAFCYCTSLTRADLPDTLTSISNYAFRYDSALKTIVFHGPAPSFGSYSFSSLTASAYYPRDDSSWTSTVRKNYGGSITWVLGEPPLTGACGDALTWELTDLGVMTVSGTGDMWDWDSYDDETYAPWNDHRDRIQKVVIGNGVTSVGDEAFKSCKNLTELSLPEGLTSVGDFAFSQCSALVEPALPSTLRYVGESGFSHVSFSRLEVFFGCGMDAFLGCGIRELILREGYSGIGDGAFAHNSLEIVYFPKSVTSVGEMAFSCPGTGIVYYAGTREDRSKISIRRGNAWLQDSAWFYDGQNTASGVCGDDLTWTVTDKGAFTISGTGDMYDFNLRSVPWLEYESLIRSVTLPEGLTSIGDYAFSGFNKMQSFELPASLKSIGDTAFRACSALETLPLPEGLESIGEASISYCNALTSIRIPASVTQIQERAFSENSALQEIRFVGAAPEIGTNAFLGVDATVYYPEEELSWSSLNMLQYGGTLTWTPESDMETVASGMFGETVSWTLKQDGTLILGGSGETEIDYTFSNMYSSQVKRVMIRPGVLLKGHISVYSSFTEYVVSDEDPNYSVLDGVLFSKDRSVLFSCPPGKECDPYIVPDSVKEIADTAFYYVEVKSVVIPEGIERIGKDAFWNVKRASLPAGIYEVCAQAFHSNLNRLDFAGSSADFMRLYMAYQNWTGGLNPSVVTCTNGTITKYGSPQNGKWFFTEDDGCVVIGAYPGLSGEISIERDTSGYDQYCYWGGTSLSTGIDSYKIKQVIVTEGVVALGTDTFRRCNQLRSVSLPEGYERIGEGMFMYCSVLKTITLPDSVKTIEKDAFWNCGLSSITLNEGLESIGDSAFGYCDGLTEIVIPESVSTMGYGVFQYAHYLKTIQMPQHMDSMGNDVFLHCEALESIRIPEGLTTMPAHLFEQCKSLKHVELPVGMKNVSSVAFRGCVSLENITLPEGMESLDNACFEGCTALREIHLPSSIKSIDIVAFRDCNALTDLYYAGGVRNWVQVEGFTVSELKNVTIHFGDAGVDSGRCGDTLFWRLEEDGTLILAGTGAMKDYASEDGVSTAPWAAYAARIQRLEADETLGSIGAYAFLGCNQLNEAQLPASLTRIGASAFSGCSALKKIHYDDTMEKWGQVTVDAGNGFVTNAHIFCTDGMLVKAHSLKSHKQIAPTCTEDGVRAYYECLVCGECFADAQGKEPLTEEELALPATGHSAAEAVEENRVEPGCTTEGGYDTVIYCSVCHEELEREHTVLAALGHSPAEAVEENRVEPGCTTEGGYDTVIYCGVCHEELERQHTQLPALGHDPSEAVEENRTEPDCTTDGGYDSVVYCKVCREELKRERMTLPATGHAWSEPVYTWAEDNSTVSARRVCAHDESHVEQETVETADYFIVSLAPECEEEGLGVYIVPFRNPAFAEQSKNAVIPALGHAWSEVSYTWSEDKTGVTALRVCARDEEHREEETAKTSYSVTREADCEADGEAVYTASFVNPAFETQSETLVLPALGHAWGEPSYTWAEDDSSVTACRICAHDENHREEETVETADYYLVTLAPDCSSEGRGRYSVPFRNPAFSEQIKEVTIPALGHTAGEAVIENRVEPSCAREGGYDTVLRCTVCGEEISRVHTVLEKLPHTPGESVTENRTEPDCTHDGGYDTVVCCTVCQEELSREHVSIPALGHDWGEVSYVWAEDLSTVTAQRSCARDSAHVESETASCDVEIILAPGCETAGSASYTASFENPAFETQTKENVPVPATGHDWGEVQYTWARDDRTVTASRVCRFDPAHVETEQADTVETLSVCPTAESAGELRYEASFANSAFQGQVKTYEIPALVQREDTGEALFSVAAPRARAGETVEVEVSILNNPGIAALTLRLFYDVEKLEFLGVSNAGMNGWVADRYLVWGGTADSDFNGVMVRLKFRVLEGCEDGLAFVTLGCDEKSVYNGDGEALRFLVSSGGVTVHSHVHRYGEPVWTWEEDLSGARAEFLCLDGDDRQTVDASVSTEESPALCETEGRIVYTASVSFEGKTYTDEKTLSLPALGHDWGEASYEWSEDLSEVQASRSCLRDPSHRESETVKTAAEVSKEPTCEELGQTTYTASFSNPAFTQQSRTAEDIPALGHVAGETRRQNETAPTCTEEGGYDEVLFCGRCGAELSRSHVTIPALGHDWGEPAWVWSEDLSTAVASFTCQRDTAHTVLLSAVITSESDKLGVTYTATVELDGKTYTDSRYREIIHPGDLSGDGEVDALDLVFMRRVILGEIEDTYATADVNGDGSVTILDLVRLKKYLAGIDVILH